MKEQRIRSYSQEKYLSDIANQIEKDSKYYQMPVKTISVTSNVHGYATFYSAIAVFEREE